MGARMAYGPSQTRHQTSSRKDRVGKILPLMKVLTLDDYTHPLQKQISIDLTA